MTPLETVLTARMRCVPIRPDHAAELAPLLQDPRVARTLTDDGLPPSDQELRQMAIDKADHWERHGFGYWVLYDRENGELVGRGGLQHTPVTGTDEIEIGWAVMPARWGQGLATELAELSIRTGDDKLGLDHLIAYTTPANLASRRVMEKTGFRYEREFWHAGLAHVLYRRTRC